MTPKEILTKEIPPMEGWCSEIKAIKIYELILARRLGLCVDLGVFGGRSLLPMALAVREAGFGHAFGIDPWDNAVAVAGVPPTANNDHEKWWGALNMEDIYQKARYAIHQQKLGETWATMLRMRGEAAAPWFRDIGFLHIDGNHKEGEAVRDVRLWCPLVRRGGIIMFDDADWPSTKAAQVELEKFGKVIGMVDQTKIVERT
jgi:hypothetical protein